MDVDEQLIEEKRSHTIVYDLGQPDYKNLKKKELVWREVAAAVKISEIECKKRWKGLRDSYKRCKRLDQVASGSAAEGPKKRWRYFEHMTFLDNVISSRHTIGNVSCALSEEDIIEMVDNDSSDGFVSPASHCSTSLREKRKVTVKSFKNSLTLQRQAFPKRAGQLENRKKKKTPPLFILQAWQPKLKQLTCHQVW